MASEEKINELRQILSRVPVVRILIDQTPDMKAMLKAGLSTEEFNERIRNKPDPVLYKIIQSSFYGRDLTVICASEECAEGLIKLITNGITEQN